MARKALLEAFDFSVEVFQLRFPILTGGALFGNVLGHSPVKFDLALDLAYDGLTLRIGLVRWGWPGLGGGLGGRGLSRPGVASLWLWGQYGGANLWRGSGGWGWGRGGCRCGGGAGGLGLEGLVRWAGPAGGCVVVRVGLAPALVGCESAGGLLERFNAREGWLGGVRGCVRQGRRIVGGVEGESRPGGGGGVGRFKLGVGGVVGGAEGRRGALMDARGR